MYIELHMLQNFAPSNLNRDDTNNPKDCEFGGHRRARISSQCLKRAIRRDPVFHQTVQADQGQRTKWMTRLLAAPLKAAGKEESETLAVATAAAAAYHSKKEKMDSKTPEKTSVLLYLSFGEIETLSQKILTNWETVLAAATAEKKDKTIADLVAPLIKETRGRTSAPDIALFGRMLADQPELGLEAACQVAHAISTHRVTMEMDYYTAVDDLLQDDEAGAGMVGFTGFNSACFYRYARISWEQLVDNLDRDYPLARRTVEGFIRAALAAVPSGKQNSMAAHNPPSLVLGVVRNNGMGWSLVNAFEKPVYPKANSGLIEPSVERLDSYWGRLCDVYGQDSITAAAALSLDPDLHLNRLGDYRVETLDALMDRLLAGLGQGEMAA
jgi:CRISPR system Cascade subunit CasC